MNPKPLKFCSVCCGRISWGGRLIRELRKHNGNSLCIHRDRWHCSRCCFTGARDPVHVAIEKGLLEAFSRG